MILGYNKKGLLSDTESSEAFVRNSQTKGEYPADKCQHNKGSALRFIHVVLSDMEGGETLNEILRAKGEYPVDKC
jgi:hypothetical protein